MKKLRLDIDSLTVETFEINHESPSSGTVHAYDSIIWGTSGGEDICNYDCATMYKTCTC